MDSGDKKQEAQKEDSPDLRILVLQDVEEPAEFFKASSLERVQQSSVEQTIEPPAMFLVEKISEVPVIQTQEKTQQVVNTRVHDVVDTVEKWKIHHPGEDQPDDQAHASAENDGGFTAAVH